MQSLLSQKNRVRINLWQMPRQTVITLSAHILYASAGQQPWRNLLAFTFCIWLLSTNADTFSKTLHQTRTVSCLKCVFSYLWSSVRRILKKHFYTSALHDAIRQHKCAVHQLTSTLDQEENNVSNESVIIIFSMSGWVHRQKKTSLNALSPQWGGPMVFIMLWGHYSILTWSGSSCPLREMGSLRINPN